MVQKNVVVHGNSLKIMEQMAPDSVDVVLTDPPYKDEDIKGLGKYKKDYYKWLESACFQMRRIAREYVIFFNGPTRLYRVMTTLGEPYRIIMWTKGVVKYPWRWEPIFIYRNPSSTYSLNRKIWTDTIPCQPLHSKQADRKYQKPLKLMQHLVSYLPEDSFVLDPFCGSGQTLIACKQRELDFLGIDSDKKACELATKNLELA